MENKKTIGQTLGITEFPFILETKKGTNKVIYKEYFNCFWNKKEYDLNNNKIYYENSNGYWEKFEYDENNNRVKIEDSTGYLKKLKYDNKNNLIYEENSNGYWNKYEYDLNNNCIHYENSNGFWNKYKYDENNNKIYYENSIKGVVFDKRNKKEIKIDDIFDRAIKLSEKAELLRPNLQIVENILLKLIEEIGELSCGILKLKQYKVNNDCSDDIINNNKEEIIDCIICCLNIVYKLGISKEEFIEIANKKLDKWDMVHLTK